MEIAEQMRIIAHGIVDSYEMRVKTVGTLIKETAGLVENLRREQEEMAGQVRDRLAKDEGLRKKDFDMMMESIREERKKKEIEVAEMLESFHRGEQEMVITLRKILTGDRKTCVEDFKTIKETILTEQKEREKKVSEMLKSFHLEQEELIAGFKRLLSKNESLKIKDFKAMVKGIRIEQKERQTELGEMLEEFRGIHEEVSNQWQKVMNTVENPVRKDFVFRAEIKKR